MSELREKYELAAASIENALAKHHDDLAIPALAIAVARRCWRSNDVRVGDALQSCFNRMVWAERARRVLEMVRERGVL